MLSEQDYNPEINKEAESTKKVSLGKIFNRAKTEIIDAITTWLKDDDKDVTRFQKSLFKSIGLGLQAGEFYQELIAQSLKKPEKEYQHTAAVSVFEESELKKLQSLKKLRQEKTSSEFAQIKQSVLSEGSQEEKTSVTEHQIRDLVFQLAGGRFRQAGGENMVEEYVENDMSPDINIATSQLVVRNVDTGIQIDLGQLLPNGFSFTPDEMRVVNYELNDKKTEIKGTIIPQDLHSYGGTKGSQGIFSEVSGTKEVRYGDLTKTGGLLALLHEISHAWQNTYYEAYGRHSFEKFYKELAQDIEILAHFKKEVETGSWDEASFNERILTPLQEKLEAQNAKINADEVFADKKNLAIDEVKMTSDINNIEFHIKSDNLRGLVADYTSQERDAWAHAIRTLRFLRHRGIDLEPRLKTLDDFRSVVDYSLSTYQKWLDRRVNFSPEDKLPPRFLKREYEDKQPATELPIDT